jgi:hypothetical protein
MAGPDLRNALRNMIAIFDRSESGNSPAAEPLRNTKSFNGNDVYPARFWQKIIYKIK